MPSIHALRQLILTSDPATLEATLGPVVLVLRPPASVYQQLARILGSGQTVRMAHDTRLAEQILADPQLYAHLMLVPLPRLGEAGAVVVGRSAACDVVVEEPSVSSRHARLRWEAAHQACLIQDLGSRNGTFVNARPIVAEAPLRHGDALSLGDAQFLLFRTDALRALLGEGPVTPG